MIERKENLTSLFKLLLFFFGFAMLIVSLLTSYNYLRHIPQDIGEYTYTNNTLFFKLEPKKLFFITLPESLTEYELILPKDAKFNTNDKLSIVFLRGVKPPPEDLKANAMYIRYHVKPIEINPIKEINLFVNDTLQYDLKDKLVLKIIDKDPKTGEVSISVFE